MTEPGDNQSRFGFITVWRIANRAKKECFYGSVIQLSRKRKFLFPTLPLTDAEAVFITPARRFLRAILGGIHTVPHD